MKEVVDVEMMGEELNDREIEMMLESMYYNMVEKGFKVA